MDKPITGQLKAVEEIESWKENAMDYLQRESLEFKGQRLFQSFYIPKADLIHNKENVHDIVCVFGFKYSLVYQRLLATLIFVANENDPRINAPGGVCCTTRPVEHLRLDKTISSVHYFTRWIIYGNIV
jgi:hypothetical protein